MVFFSWYMALENTISNGFMDSQKHGGGQHEDASVSKSSSLIWKLSNIFYF